MAKAAVSRPHSSALRKGRYSAPGLAYFVTTAVDQRRPLLDPPARELVIQSLLWARAQGRIWLLGYVIMDDHFHVLIALRGDATLAQLTDSLKRHTARRANLMRSQTGRFWQAGYHDHAIRDELDLWGHVRYMHENPVRRGWVTRAEDYAWSTAHSSRRLDVDWNQLGYADH
jgi:REP element-mobilizing transposase RayT